MISYCIEQIALDGEEGPFSSPFSLQSLTSVIGTSLELLWKYVGEFVSTKPQRREESEEIEEIDDDFRMFIWRYLLRHDEIVLKAGDKVLSNKELKV